MIDKLIKETKKAVVTVIKGGGDVVTALEDTVKMVTVRTLKDAGGVPSLLGFPQN